MRGLRDRARRVGNHADRVAAIAACGVAALPVSLGIGILKFRLYDIDRIISRTLAYTIVTGLLVGLYAGLVLLATKVLAVSSPVAVAGATLVAAALFNVLRRRVQRVVDRRFNRARYDAEATVALFAARLKNTVDADSVTGDLAAVVQQALQPASLSVWMRELGSRLDISALSSPATCPWSPGSRRRAWRAAAPGRRR